MALVFAEKSLKTGPTVFTPCPEWVSFKVENVKILYNPGVFGDSDNSANRVNICLQSIVAQTKILSYELSLSGGNICSCIKEEHIKAKMSWDKIQFFDISGTKVQRPDSLAGYTANVMFLIKGKWSAMGQVGLCLEVSHIQLMQGPQEAEDTCPFDDLSNLMK